MYLLLLCMQPGAHMHMSAGITACLTNLGHIHFVFVDVTLWEKTKYMLAGIYLDELTALAMQLMIMEISRIQVT